MKTKLAGVLALLVVALVAVGCTHFTNSQGWAALIDGERGMENWYPTGHDANWRAAEGAIMADQATGKGASVLASKKTFKDFDLYVEFWADHDTNSGIYIRAPNPKLINTASGAYEVQIWAKNPNPAYSTGSLVNVASVAPIYKAGGRWNVLEVHAKGPDIIVRLNGAVTVSARDAKSPEGRMGIQYNAGPIKVRKFLVREL